MLLTKGFRLSQFARFEIIHTSGLRTSYGVCSIRCVKPFLIVMVALCLPVTGALKKKTDVERVGFKGRVKSVTHSSFKITEKFGIPFREKFGGFTASNYDEKGNKLEEMQYDASGKLTVKTNYKYDAGGNQIERVNYIAGGKPSCRYTFKYDQKGNLVEETEYNGSENLTSKYTSKYDAKGNQIERVNYGAGGMLIGEHTFKYDENGNMVEKVYYDASGNLSG